MRRQVDQGVFITIEGIEGVGKSTAIKYIQYYLTRAKKDLVVTREPGGTSLAEQIREVLLTPSLNGEVMAPETELLLMFACRAQHMAKLIMPSLLAGKWVVSDRFVDASYAYQGGGRQLDLSHIEMLERWIVHGLKPNITILLDAPPEVGLLRAKHRSPHDRIEQEKIDFFERVRAVYLLRARQEAARFRIIDATQPLETVQTEITAVLDELISVRVV